jgi:hypothetical protein
MKSSAAGVGVTLPRIDSSTGDRAIFDAFVAGPRVNPARQEGKHKYDPWRGVGISSAPFDSSRARVTRPDREPGVRRPAKPAKTLIGGQPTSAEAAAQYELPTPVKYAAKQRLKAPKGDKPLYVRVPTDAAQEHADTALAAARAEERLADYAAKREFMECGVSHADMIERLEAALEDRDGRTRAARNIKAALAIYRELLEAASS